MSSKERMHRTYSNEEKRAQSVKACCNQAQTSANEEAEVTIDLEYSDVETARPSSSDFAELVAAGDSSVELVALVHCPEHQSLA